MNRGSNLLSCTWHVVYLLLKLEDTCHIWITDFQSSCDCRGGAVRYLVVSFSGWGYSPGLKTLIAFQSSCARRNTSCDLLSHQPWPEAPSHMIHLTLEEHAQPYGGCTFTSAVINWPWPLHPEHVNVINGGLWHHIAWVTPQILVLDKCDEWSINNLPMSCSTDLKAAFTQEKYSPSLALTDNL